MSMTYARNSVSSLRRCRLRSLDRFTKIYSVWTAASFRWHGVHCILTTAEIEKTASRQFFACGFCRLHLAFVSTSSLYVPTFPYHCQNPISQPWSSTSSRILLPFSVVSDAQHNFFLLDLLSFFLHINHLGNHFQVLASLLAAKSIRRHTSKSLSSDWQMDHFQYTCSPKLYRNLAKY